MPLIICKIHLELSWTKECIMSNIDGNTTFQIASTKLYVPIVTLSTKHNIDLTNQFDEGFKRSVYWNECKSKIENVNLVNNNATRFPLDASFQGVNRLFVLAFDNATFYNSNGGPNKVESHKNISSQV